MEFIWLALAGGSLLYGYTAARQFVRTRLRFVDAALSRKAALVAGLGAAAVTLPLFMFLPIPFFNPLTAALFGLSVGAGVRAGARAIASNPAGYLE